MTLLIRRHWTERERYHREREINKTAGDERGQEEASFLREIRGGEFSQADLIVGAFCEIINGFMGSFSQLAS